MIYCQVFILTVQLIRYGLFTCKLHKYLFIISENFDPPLYPLNLLHLLHPLNHSKYGVFFLFMKIITFLKKKSRFP